MTCSKKTMQMHQKTQDETSTSVANNKIATAKMFRNKYTFDNL